MNLARCGRVGAVEGRVLQGLSLKSGTWIPSSLSKVSLLEKREQKSTLSGCKGGLVTRSCVVWSSAVDLRLRWQGLLKGSEPARTECGHCRQLAVLGSFHPACDGEGWGKAPRLR